MILLFLSSNDKWATIKSGHLFVSSSSEVTCLPLSSICTYNATCYLILDAQHTVPHFPSWTSYLMHAIMLLDCYLILDFSQKWLHQRRKWNSYHVTTGIPKWNSFKTMFYRKAIRNTCSNISLEYLSGYTIISLCLGRSNMFNEFVQRVCGQYGLHGKYIVSGFCMSRKLRIVDRIKQHETCIKYRVSRIKYRAACIE